MSGHTEVLTEEMLQRLEAIERKLDEVRAFMVRHERVLSRLERLEERTQTLEKQMEGLKVRIWAVGMTAGAVVATVELMLRVFLR